MSGGTRFSEMKRCFIGLHPNIQGKTGTNSEVTKKCVTQKNQPSETKRTEKFLSSTSILGPTALSISARWDCQICSLSHRVVVHSRSGKVKVPSEVRAEASFLSSRLLRRRWPSCHRILSRCICHLLRCHSSGRRTTPLTVEVRRGVQVLSYLWSLLSSLFFLSLSERCLINLLFIGGQECVFIQNSV